MLRRAFRALQSRAPAILEANIFAESTGMACRRGDSERANGQGQLDPMIDALRNQLSDLAKYDSVFFVLCVSSTIMYNYAGGKK